MIEVISSVDNPEPPVEEQNEMDIVETAVSVVVEDREPAIKPNPAQPNKPAASLLPLADYGASDSEDSAAESSDDSDIEVQTHAFSLGGPIIKRKEREAPSTMDVPVADPDEEVDYELE